jgi:hypothetical protein
MLRQFDFLSYVKTNLALFLVSAALGSASHVFWDNFTHYNGFFVKHLSFYSTFVPFDGARYPLFYVLQQFSTAVGLSVVILYVIFQKPDLNSTPRKPSPVYWGIVTLFIILILALRFGLDRAGLNLGNFVVSCISAGLLALFVNGFLNFRQASA